MRLNAVTKLIKGEGSMFDKLVLLNPIALNTFAMAPRRPLEVWGEFSGENGYHSHLAIHHCVPDT